MNKEQVKDIKKEIDDLINKIKQWNYEYYILNESSVSDSVYDEYYQKLINLEIKYPQFARTDSPTKTVGSEVSSSTFKKVVHKIPMLSLSNAFSKEDLIKFDQQVKKISNRETISYVCELKIDGLSIAVSYENGNLKLAATRGDGTLGEDITENLKEIATIPKALQNCLVTELEVRGEVFLSKENFANLNQEQEALNLPMFANPRNAASGTIRQLDKSSVAKRKLDAFIYYYVGALDAGLKTHSQALQQLEKYNFKVNKEWKLCQDIDEIWDYIQKYQELRFSLPYEIDGIVLKVDDLSLYKLLGNTNKAPRWAIAYKFPALKVTTQLLEIFPTVGRTGKITYNAKLKPVLLAGSKISFATLHNGDYIIDRDFRETDIVEIKKAGDIIPEVIRVIESKRNISAKKFQKATNCPKCSSILEQVESEVDQYCVNTNCPARILKSLIHFCSRNAMNIVGLSEKTLGRFLELGWIKDIADIFELVKYRKEILELENFGEKSFNNLVANIVRAKNNSLERLLFGLGVRHVGQKIATTLAFNFKNLQNLMKAEFEDIAKIKDVGTVIATSVVDYFANIDNQQLIEKLKNLNVNFNFLQSQSPHNQIFANMTFVITGTLSKSRDYFANLLKQYGAVVTNSISANTNYLLVGKNPGSKFDKAKKMNIKILNEQELLLFISNQKNDIK